MGYGGKGGDLMRVEKLMKLISRAYFQGTSKPLNFTTHLKLLNCVNMLICEHVKKIHFEKLMRTGGRTKRDAH